MSRAPDILYIVSHGFAARMVLHSDLLAELKAKGLSVAIMSPNAGEPHFEALCAQRGALAIQAPKVAGHLLGEYAQSRRYLFEDYENNAALRAKHLWEMHGPSRLVFRARAAAGKAINSALLKAPRLVDGLATAERRLLRSKPLHRLLTDLRPRMVVATYPVAWLDALAVIEAQRLGIPTVGQLLSWDNITCKGRFAAIPDRFISWGPIMTAELAEHYGVHDALETGVAHFDLHARPVDRGLLADALRKLGLDPDRPYLFFGMSARFFAPHEADIVAWLADRVRDGAFGRGMQLLVRPHPQSMRGPMADAHIVSTLRKVEGASVAIDLPEVVSDGVDMAAHDMTRLAALLSGAAVTLNSGSTLSIDALIHDRPVILTMFDGDAVLPWWESARRLEEFPHLTKLLAHGGVRVARSFPDLERLVQQYLVDPALDHDARLRTREAECGPADGGACRRIADGLTRLLGDGDNRRRGGLHGATAG